MNSIVKLDIEILVSGSEEEIDQIIADPISIVNQECFARLGKRILQAKILDSELLDDDIDLNKMLEERFAEENRSA